MSRALGILTNATTVRQPGPFRAPHRSRLPAVHLLAVALAREGVQLVFGRLEDFSFSTRTYRSAWTWTGRDWVFTKQVVVDRVIFQAAGRTTAYRYGLFRKQANDLYRDKWRTVQFARSASPRTWLVHSRSQAERIRIHLYSARFVLKPRYGSASKGVSVHASDRPIERRVFRDTILQEFIEPLPTGPLGGNVICRFILVNGQIALRYAKVATNGRPVVAVRLGARRRVIRPDDVPPRVRSFVRDVDRRLGVPAPSWYAIDVRLDTDGQPFLVECNGTPAWPVGSAPEYRAYYRAFARMVRQAIR